MKEVIDLKKELEEKFCNLMELRDTTEYGSVENETVVKMLKIIHETKEKINKASGILFYDENSPFNIPEKNYK